jgi:hypothetical protein
MAQIAHFFGMGSSLILKDDGVLSYRTAAKIAKSENIFSYMKRQPIEAVAGLNRPAGGLLVIDVSKYPPFRTTGRTAIEIFLNRQPEGNVIAFLRDPIGAHLTHTSPA